MRRDRRPHDGVLLALVLAMLALPALGALGTTELGAYRMFSRPRDHLVRVLVFDARGVPRPIAADRMLPHMSRAARRNVHLGAGYRTGETHVELLEAGLEDLGELACALTPDATRAEVILEQRPWFLAEDHTRRRRAAVPCP